MAAAGRVIAGSARGVRLMGAGGGTRPLADRLKEALFGTLEAATLGAWPAPFLDLFAGTGAAGIEALSRGAPRAVFVERAPVAAAILEQNLARARDAARGEGDADWDARVVRAGALAFLDRPAGAEGGPFGAVLLDPPYGGATLLPALERLGDAARGWLAEESLVVAKHFWRDMPPADVGGLHRVRERRFGESALSFYSAHPARGGTVA